MVERSHAKLKKIRKTHVNVARPQWDRYVVIAIMAHNTTYHPSLTCSPTEIFHRRTPYNDLDLKYSYPEKRVDTNFGDVNKILDRMNEIYRDNTDNIIAAYHNTKLTMTEKPRHKHPNRTTLFSCLTSNTTPRVAKKSSRPSTGKARSM